MLFLETPCLSELVTVSTSVVTSGAYREMLMLVTTKKPTSLCSMQFAVCHYIKFTLLLMFLERKYHLTLSCITGTNFDVICVLMNKVIIYVVTRGLSED